MAGDNGDLHLGLEDELYDDQQQQQVTPRRQAHQQADQQLQQLIEPQGGHGFLYVPIRDDLLRGGVSQEMTLGKKIEFLV